MRLPNKYGSISKLSGKRRNPWMILIHCDKDEFGHRIRKPLSYHKTYREAFDALNKYHEKPFDLTKKKPTFSDVYQSWFAGHVDGKSKSLKNIYSAAYKSFYELHDLPFEEIRPLQFDRIFKSFKSSKSKKNHMALLINMLYVHAIKLDITDKDYSGMIDKGLTNDPKDKTIFNELEIKKISKMTGFIPDALMILLYTGMRISELLSLKNENVDFDTGTIKCGSKTDAGKNRIIPIHPSLMPILYKYYDSRKTFLITQSDKAMTYNQFSKLYAVFSDETGIKHSIHETRHTFITMLDELHAPDAIVQLIVGHIQKEFTKRVYTHNTIGKLKETILLLSNF